VELSFQMEAPAVPGTVIQVRVTPSRGHVRASVHRGGANALLLLAPDCRTADR
jgi:hypothetical protein